MREFRKIQEIQKNLASILSFSYHNIFIYYSFVFSVANSFGLCVRAGFGAQNCQPALKLNRSTMLQVCTSPRLTQNPCVCPACACSTHSLDVTIKLRIYKYL